MGFVIEGMAGSSVFPVFLSTIDNVHIRRLSLTHTSQKLLRVVLMRRFCFGLTAEIPDHSAFCPSFQMQTMKAPGTGKKKDGRSIKCRSRGENVDSNGEANGDVLPISSLDVQAVTACQRLRLKGTHGTWEEFLTTVSDLEGAAISNNPARSSRHILQQFLRTLGTAEDHMFETRLKRWYALKEEEARVYSRNPWPPCKENNLVLRTRKNPRYAEYFNFPSFLEDWVFVPSAEYSDPASTRLLAMDCEMCGCEGGINQLVRISVVDSDGDVLIDTLVKPNKAVVDYRAHITGISEAHLKDVKFSQKDAQVAIASLLTAGTIVVGHGLDNDWKVLKLDYGRVIDTALLLRIQGMPRRPPSLQYLCKVVLKKDFRQGQNRVHDSVQDAIIPLQLVQHEMKMGPIPLLPPPEADGEAQKKKLLIHNILKLTTPHHLTSLFPPRLSPVIESVKWKNGYGSTIAEFSSAEDADIAFLSLRGKQKIDDGGYMQKRAKLMAYDGSEEGTQLVTVRVTFKDQGSLSPFSPQLRTQPSPQPQSILQHQQPQPLSQPQSDGQDTPPSKKLKQDSEVVPLSQKKSRKEAKKKKTSLREEEIQAQTLPLPLPLPLTLKLGFQSAVERETQPRQQSQSQPPAPLQQFPLQFHSGDSRTVAELTAKVEQLTKSLRERDSG